VDARCQLYGGSLFFFNSISYYANFKKSYDPKSQPWAPLNPHTPKKFRQPKWQRCIIKDASFLPKTFQMETQHSKTPHKISTSHFVADNVILGYDYDTLPVTTYDGVAAAFFGRNICV